MQGPLLEMRALSSSNQNKMKNFLKNQDHFKELTELRFQPTFPEKFWNHRQYKYERG